MIPAAPPSSPRPERNTYIDALRGVSILGVVCVHFAGSFVTTDAHAWSPSFYLGLALNQIFSFAVPLFVFLSGLLAGSTKKEPALLDYYSGRFWRIVVPYLTVSVVAFFAMNHYATWREVPGMGAKVSWLVQRVGFYGVEPTLYFIPLILQLYLLQPLLKQLPGALSRRLPSLAPARAAWLVTLLLLGVHVALGLLCYRGVLNYYAWGRPNSLFWMFYFFAGLHFHLLIGSLSAPILRRAGLAAALVAFGAMGWNAFQLNNPAVVGAHFEFNRLDFAYARPEMLVYDLAALVALAVGIARQWSPRPGALVFLGQFTLEIYLWHILVLYYGAWRFPSVLAACRQMPELIVLICIAAAFGIAGFTHFRRRVADFVQTHRLRLSRAD